MIGVGAFKKHTSMLRTMSEAYVENRGVWIRCAYNKARNDYIKTRDSVTDSIVFHFEEDENVLMGDILNFNDTYYALANLVPDTFFHLKMRKRAAGLELPFTCNIYSVQTTIDAYQKVLTASYKYNNVRFALQKDTMDSERSYALPFDNKIAILSYIYDIAIGDGIESQFGNFYVKDIDYKLPGTNALMISKDSRDFELSE